MNLVSKFCSFYDKFLFIDKKRLRSVHFMLFYISDGLISL